MTKFCKTFLDTKVRTSVAKRIPSNFRFCACKIPFLIVANLFTLSVMAVMESSSSFNSLEKTSLSIDFWSLQYLIDSIPCKTEGSGSFRVT